jgi:hypothetical protein
MAAQRPSGRGRRSAGLILLPSCVSCESSNIRSFRRGEDFRSGVSPLQATTPTWGCGTSFLVRHIIDHFAASDVHHERRQLVQVAGSFGHTPLSCPAFPGAMGAGFKLRHYPKNPCQAPPIPSILHKNFIPNHIKHKNSWPFHPPQFGTIKLVIKEEARLPSRALAFNSATFPFFLCLVMWPCDSALCDTSLPNSRGSRSINQLVPGTNLTRLFPIF